MCNVQYVPSPERFRFSIAHCSLLIAHCSFRASGSGVQSAKDVLGEFSPRPSPPAAGGDGEPIKRNAVHIQALIQFAFLIFCAGRGLLPASTWITFMGPMQSPGSISSALFAAAILVAGFPPMSFAAVAEVLSAPLVPRGAVWRFLDNGSNQGTNWIGLDFNDASWSSGAARLGYGGDGEVTTVAYGPNASAKYITTYFRRPFELADASVFQSLKLRLVRDDLVSPPAPAAR